MLINLKQNNFNIEVNLPLSKSESNRALMIAFYLKTQRLIDSESQRLCDFATLRLCDFITLQLSDSDDTVLLKNLLDKTNQYIYHHKQSQLSVDSCPLTLDCANAGTVFRFLMTAVASLQLTINNEKSFEVFRFSDFQILSFLLTGNERMKQRPIDSLVDALRSLGVSIEYTERESYPPVLIRPRNIEGGRVEVNVEQSSQFASSLLLAAPLWKNGLELYLKGDISSLPYIDMTINMMKQCGIDVIRKDRDILVKPGNYNIDDIKMEPDWSAAAFWYEIAALSEYSDIFLKNLNIDSLQADSVAIKMFENLGVETILVKEGVKIRNTTFNSQPLTFNFKDCPDLFPSVIATCAGLKVNATFTGLKNLSIKESDRKKAMMTELKKINVSFEEISDDELKMICPEELPFFTEENPIIFNNYNDHRIAMALSILSIKIGAIEMKNTEVVSKSYPNFFETVGY